MKSPLLRLIALLVLLVCNFDNLAIPDKEQDLPAGAGTRSSVYNGNSYPMTTVHVNNATNTAPAAPESPQGNPNVQNVMSGIKMANPADKIMVINPPGASQMGSAALSFPIKLPPGRNGMQPQVSVDYNSEGGNSWMGLDWNLGVHAIMIETRWGVPLYDPSLETETYLMHGEQFTPVAHRSDPIARAAEKEFHHRVEFEFEEVIRHGSHPANYWWETTDKNGQRTFYGGTPAGGVDQAAVLTDANGNIAYWAMTEQRDVNDNFIKYRYRKVLDAGIASGSAGSDLYLSSISYTGHGNTEGKFIIEFICDRQLGEPKRPDVSINARWGFKQVTADLLRKIFVKYNGQNVRSYELAYAPGAFHKSLLRSITEFDAAGVLFNTHSFEYYNDVQNGNGSYQPLLASEAWNPQTDDIRGTFLNPIDHFNDKASALSGNKSMGGGFGMAITIGPYDANLSMKTNTAGVAFGFNYSKNEGMLALVDINGDGLTDKVFKKNGGLRFRPNQSGPNGNITFGAERSINGIDDFSRGETFIGEIGLESHFGIFAGFEYTRTEEITSIYFSDVNGDNLADIVKDGKVYFNHIDNNGEPSFTLSSGDTPSPINAASGIDPDLVENDPAAFEKSIDDNPLHDVVKIWRAPFTGTVSITAPVALTADTSPDGQAYTDDDGVRVAIQHKGSELWSADIAAGDFATKAPSGVGAIAVQKGDKIYFRVQSKFNGAYDKVSWSPQVTYSTHTPALTDANNLPLYQFKADDDFLISGAISTGMSIGGTVHIMGTFVKPLTSDDVTVKILRKSNNVTTTLLQQTFSWNQVANLPIAIDQAVLKDDALFFSVSSNTNVDWTALQWNPFLYYTTSSDPSVTQLFDADNKPLLSAYPTVDFQSFNRTIQPSLSWTAPASDTFSILASPSFQFNLKTGDIVFTIKKQNELVAKQIIPVNFGVVGAHAPISLVLNNGDKLFFEYHIKNDTIADALLSSNVVVDADPGSPQNVTAGTHTTDVSFLFGPMYRHWGQFAYNGNRTRATQPIIESDLHLDESLTDQTPPSIDLSGIDNADDMQDHYGSEGGNQPKDDKFIFLVPDNAKKLWIGYDNFTYVKRDTISASRMGKDNLNPVNPIGEPSPGTGSGAVGIKKVSNTDNFSLAAGFGVGVSTSFGYTNYAYDFNDMNGDRYPDILSRSKIQYTNPYGGLKPTASNFSFGDVVRSEHFSAGITLGGTFLKSSPANEPSTSKGSKANKAAEQSGISMGITGNFNYNRDSTAFSWLDINGDDLPDRVYRNGNVELNLGYSFLPAEQWGFTGVHEGTAISYGAGLGVNIGSYSISAGIGVTRSESETNRTLQDMNGDGLLDYITSISPLRVAINTGSGFAAPIEWAGASAIHKGMSTGESANGAFTIGFTIIPPVPVVKLCINPSFTVAQGAEKTLLQFEDIDGDGFPDLLQSGEDNELTVSRSGIRRTNKLKKVNRPLGAHFTLDYKRVGNTYLMPHSIWALASVDIYDGAPGDGADRMRNTYDYEEGRYDRHERQFYGFKKVTTFHHDTENSDVVYRKIEEEYLNDNYYERGLLKSETFKNAAGNKFKETINTYVLKDPHDGATLPDAFKQTDDGEAFPALVGTQQLFYEGQNAPGKTTSMTYAYDLLGNVTGYTDFGDPGNADDVSAQISYHAIPAKFIMNVPSEVTITGNGQVYRRHATTIDNNGNITERRHYLESGDIAKFNMVYDAVGNMTMLTKPQNATGQRLTFNFEYDADVRTYNIKTTDGYGYTSSSTHDVRFGQLLSSTDINGQKILYALDNKGRILTITGPLEIAAGRPFTVAMEYHPEAVVPWALTKHFDPSHPANFIETATFTDGLGRVIQTKKDGALFTGAQSPDQEVMLVSGEDKYDAFGRTKTVYHPTTEPKGSTGQYNTQEDNITPITTVFDVLDRTLLITLPDGTTLSNEYGFGTDRDGATQFKTKTKDGNGISIERFTNVRSLIKAKKEQYSQGSDVWTSYEYNPVDELIKVTDNAGNMITSVYDRMGRRTSVNHPDAGVTNYQYDLNNKVTQINTANLQNGPGIKYTYDHERIVKITYPQNTQNNVELTYGAPGAGFFRAGRVIKQQDASGSQEFFYNPHGRMVKNTRVIIVPGVTPLTHITQWTYDTWNRLTGMVYPDGETLTYNYNTGGLLQSMSGIKSGTAYNYMPQTGYDKFEERVYMRYGNGTEMTFAYEPERRRLKKLTAETAGNRLMMDNTYTYDRKDNVLSVVNNAPVPPSSLMGGRSSYQYAYDDLYRLTNAGGTFGGSSHEHRYTLSMQYNTLSSILSKNQVHERKGYDETTWTLRNQTSYNYNYNYDPAGKPHAAIHIGEQAFTYDANGNQAGWDHDVSAQNRQIIWDEENRIKSLSDNGELFNYTYDAQGIRVLKSNGQVQSVSINGNQAGQATGLDNHTVYVNPFMVIRSGGFTKHFYIGDQRIVSKLGESGNGNSNAKGGGGGGGNGNAQEAFQFYYHSDHLGNTAFVTDRLGEVYQHLEYFPFGETMVEEHSNQERTTYLYNGKELDEETALYYYGARYYDSRTSTWPSIDPLWELPDEVNKSPYAYVTNNPLIYYDIDGRGKHTKKKEREWEISEEAALEMIEPSSIKDFSGKKLKASSGVEEGDVGSYSIIQHLEKVGDGLTGDHQPSGAAVKEAIRLSLHDVVTMLTRSQARNAYKKAVTIVVTDAWHKAYSRTYGGRNSKAQIAADADDLYKAAEADWAVYEQELISEGFKPAEIKKMKTRLRTAQESFFKTGKLQFLPMD